MTYRIQGILKLPDGTPAANCEIEFVSRKNFSPLVQGAKTNILTSAVGAYDVTLEFGEYAVILYTGGTYPAQVGIISVLADTTPGKDLPTLLNKSDWTPATPEYIQQIEAWMASSGENAAAAELAANEAKASAQAAAASETQTAGAIAAHEAKVGAHQISGVAGLQQALDSKENSVREALRRSYAEAGFTLVDGSFEEGGTLTSTSDVLLHKASGKAYSWTGAYPVGGYVVAPGTDPTVVPGYVPRTDVVLRSDLAGVDGSALIGMANYTQIRAYTGTSTRINCLGRANIFDGAGGLFAVDAADTTTADEDGYCLVDTTGRRWKRIGFTAIDPAWYGAVSDYDSTTKSGTSSSAAFFKAVSLAAAGVKPEWQAGQTYKEVCRTVRPRTGNYKFTTSVPIPSGVIVDCNNSTIGGDGYTDTDCEAFVTGYIDTDGILKSNLSLGAEVCRVMSAQLINWRATNLKKFFNAKNFNEGSICTNGYAYNVQQVIKARRSFYGEFSHSVSRGSAGGTALAAYQFDDFVNVMNLDGLVGTDRGTVMSMSGGLNGQNLRNQTYEGSQNGLTITGEVYPALISSNYFEGLAGSGLNLGDYATKRNVVIDNNWFFQVGQVGIIANNMQGGKIGCGNYFADNVTVNVEMDDIYSTATVEIPPYRYAGSTASLRPAFPSAKYALGQAVDVKYRVHIYDNSTGVTVATQNYAGDRPIDFNYSGKQGFIGGKVAFCDYSKTAGATFSVVVDTKIYYDNYVMWCFCLSIADNSALHRIAGRGYGSNVYLDVNTGAKTVTASNVDGYLRLTISDFYNPAEAYSCEGVVRHM